MVAMNVQTSERRFSWWWVVRVGWLALVAGAIGKRLTGAPVAVELAGALLTAVAAVGWLGWLVLRPDRHRRLVAVSLAAIGVFGGAVAAFTPTGLAFSAVAALCAGLVFDPPASLVIATVGPVAGALAVAGLGGSTGLMVGGFAAALAGLAVGTTRRQDRIRVEQTAMLDVEHERAAAHEARAEALADRNRLAREVHDVLAHTLSAVSIQLEALDGTLSDAGADEAALISLRRTRKLVIGGLDETRLAVRSLRETPVPLVDQLTVLATERSAEICVLGNPRPLAPEAGLALYRAAQEALTNAAKHAPGAPVALTVDFEPERMTLTAENQSTPNCSPLAATGGGYGLRGIHERIRLLGGYCHAGPTTDGWQIQVEVAA